LNFNLEYSFDILFHSGYVGDNPQALTANLLIVNLNHKID
jgi:hypothetical protein